MKNEEEPKDYFERNTLFIILVGVSGLFLNSWSVWLITQTNPWGTLIAVPGLVLTLQALWLLVNPYAIVYQDRVEIKQNLIYDKTFYYLDAKSITFKSKYYLLLMYNDGDLENIPLFGMRNAHKVLFEKTLAEKMALSVKERVF